MILWARWRGFLELRMFDVAAPALALGYAIGRVGCQLSGDGDYGRATDLPWGMAYPEGTVRTLQEVHPTPSSRRSRWADRAGAVAACATAFGPAGCSRSTSCWPAPSGC